MRNKTINVLYIVSSTSYLSIFASMQSVLDNNIFNRIKFYIMYDDNFPEKDKARFNYFVKRRNCDGIEWVHVDEPLFKRKLQALYLLAAGKYINEDKVLYLSNYAVVTKSLSDLYNTDIQDYLCAAPEHLHSDYIKEKYNYQNETIYCQLVTLINLNKWREENIYSKLLAIDFSKYDNYAIGTRGFNEIIKECLLLDYSYGYAENNNYWFGKSDISCSENTCFQYHLFKTHQKIPNIILYVGRHPMFQKESENSYLNVWWKYIRKTPIYFRTRRHAPLTLFEKITSIFHKKNRAILTREFLNSDFYKYMSFIIKYIKPYWFGALFAFGLAIPIGCLDAVIALSLKPYMDVVMIEKNTQSPWYIPLLIVLFTSMQGLLNFAATYSNDWVTGKVSSDIKRALYNKLMHKGTNFLDKKTSGDVQKSFNNDADRVCTGIFGGVKLTISRVFSSLSLMGVLIYNSWQLAIIAIAILICAVIPLTKIRARIRSVTNQSENAFSVVITDYNELYGGSKIVKAFNLYNLKNNIFDKHLNDIFNLKMQISKKTGIISPIMHSIIAVGIGLSIGYGSYLITSGQLTSGSFVSFITALIMLYNPIKGLNNNMKTIQTSLFALERVVKQLNAEAYIVDAPHAIDLTSFEQGIEFDHVNFQYINNRPVLKNISFYVKKGETFALVGNSGGGKTTIVNLIPRFYKLTTGSIKIDGIDISEYKLNSLRDNISIVLQDNFLFAGTIRENILMGKLDATEEELLNAVHNACLTDFINSLKKGLDTYIGEKGVLLSGGQKQRIAIARAFIKNAPIVILDEATSALDNQAEAIVQEAINNLMKDKTVFVIAHRLSTVRNADRIAVINKGKLVELGNHEELMQIENGEYKKLYEMQFKSTKSPVLV